MPVSAFLVQPLTAGFKIYNKSDVGLRQGVEVGKVSNFLREACPLHLCAYVMARRQ